MQLEISLIAIFNRLTINILHSKEFNIENISLTEAVFECRGSQTYCIVIIVTFMVGQVYYLACSGNIFFI